MRSPSVAINDRSAFYDKLVSHRDLPTRRWLDDGVETAGGPYYKDRVGF
jgi:hypothetical protein